MKKTLSVLVITSLLFLSACSNKENQVIQETKEAAKTFLLPLSTNEFNDKIKNKATGMIYIGRPSCPDCQAFQPLLKKELAKRKMPKIFYYDTEKASLENKKALQTTLKKIKVSTIPTLVYLNKGKVSFLFSGSNEKEKLASWLDNVLKE